MSTFWKRISERMFGPVPGMEDEEIGALGGSLDPVEVEGFGSTVEIRYSGALSGSGSPLYVHFGIGPGDWSDVSEAPMHPVAATGVFQAEIGVAGDEGRLEFCFRNENGEWDNNHGNNWAYPL